MDDKQSSLYPMFGTQPSHCPKLLKYHSFVSLFSVYNYTLSQITIMVDSEPPPELVNDAGEKQRSLEKTTEPPHGNGGIQSGDKGLKKQMKKERPLTNMQQTMAIHVVRSWKTVFYQQRQHMETMGPTKQQQQQQQQQQQKQQSIRVQIKNSLKM